MDNETRTSDLISSADVNNTEVYSRQGDHIGHIDHLMIDKVSGNVAYAVMHFGGFLGMGEDWHPVPWNALEYDTGKGGYVTDITEEQLKGAPERSANWSADRDWEQRTHDYYAAKPYWWM